LHSEPILEGTTSDNNGGRMYGTEYQNTGDVDKNHNYDAACSVCISKTAMNTVWGRKDCDDNASGKELVYTGYIMANEYTQYKGEFVCVDEKRKQHLRSKKEDNDGNMWYTTEAQCGSLPCGPYVNDRELACAVCRVEDAKATQVRTTFDRWGSRTCQSTQMYTGYTAGAHRSQQGSGFNQVCLHEKPTWNEFNDRDQNGARMYGTEYQNTGSLDKNNNRDAACAVCGTTNRATHTVWGRVTCPYGNNWVQEYTGYAMATSTGQYKTETVCVDKKREEHKFSSDNDQDGNLFYTTEFRETIYSGSYQNGADLPCVVCSRS